VPLSQGLSALRHLKKLSVQSNRLTKIENLEALTELEVPSAPFAKRV
jgi:hypothetical protein